MLIDRIGKLSNRNIWLIVLFLVICVVCVSTFVKEPWVQAPINIPLLFLTMSCLVTLWDKRTNK